MNAHDHSNMRLGRRPAVHDARRRALAPSLIQHLPPPPEVVDNTNGIRNWGMMRNDSLGDCTIAAIAHAMQQATMLTGNMVVPTDEDVVEHYSEWCGYQPGNEATDNGGIELDVLTRFQAAGWGAEKLLNWVDPNPHDILAVKQSIAHFGGVYVGVDLPVAAQTQLVWDVAADDGGVWGGHAMLALAYDATYVTYVTWGRLQRATWAWWLRYTEECHTLLLQTWLHRYPSATVQDVLVLLQDSAEA